jgi:hypothetical protein
MSEGSNVFQYRKPTGPCLLAALPLGAIALSSLAAPIGGAGPRLGASLVLAAISVSLAAMGWPRRLRHEVDGTGTVTNPSRQVVLSGVTHLRVTHSEDTGRFGLLASHAGSSIELYADSNPGEVLTGGTRLASRLGLRLDLDFPAATRDEPIAWRVSQPVSSSPLNVLKRWSRVPRVGYWLGWGGCCFTLAVLGTFAHAHWQRTGAFGHVSIALGAFMSAIALWIAQLGCRAQVWFEASDDPSTASGAKYRCVARNLLGRRVRVAWDERTPLIGMLPGCTQSTWLLFGVEDQRVEAVRVAVPFAVTPPTPDAVELAEATPRRSPSNDAHAAS